MTALDLCVVDCLCFLVFLVGVYGLGDRLGSLVFKSSVWVGFEFSCVVV